MPGARLSLIEFPANDPGRARRLWEGLLDDRLEERVRRQRSGRQTRGAGLAIGIHALRGSVIHGGEAWSVCRDCEGTPFGLSVSEE